MQNRFVHNTFKNLNNKIYMLGIGYFESMERCYVMSIMCMGVFFFSFQFSSTIHTTNEIVTQQRLQPSRIRHETFEHYYKRVVPNKHIGWDTSANKTSDLPGYIVTFIQIKIYFVNGFFTDATHLKRCASDKSVKNNQHLFIQIW